MKTQKAVIFDMDGVLFDTERLCKKAWCLVAREQGIRDIEKVSEQCIGRNANDTKDLVMKYYGPDFAYDAFRERVSEWVWDHHKRYGVPVKKGVRELLDYLQGSEYRIGLASSSRREAVLSHLTGTGLLPFFPVIVTGDMVKHSKPRPDIYLLACREAGVEPRDACAIEDSPNGIRAAHAAGMKPIMVPDMVAPDEETGRMCCRIFEDLLGVRDFLKSGLEL